MEVDALIDAVVSHAAALGMFEMVNQHEPKSAPAVPGLTAAVWSQHVVPIPQLSGLDRTAGRVLMQLRIYQNMLTEPQDAIDPAVMKAVDALFTAYSADFTLDGLVNHVDLLGAYGVPLAGEAGYIAIDNALHRCYTLDVPLIIDRLWNQVP